MSTAQKFSFTAPVGVTIMGEAASAAVFKRRRDNNDGPPVYVFATDDAKIAALIRDTDGFGIVEAKAPSATAKAK